VRTLANLRGLRVAPPLQYSPMEVQLDYGLKDYNLDLADVEITNLALPDMVPRWRTARSTPRRWSSRS
jgi:ABC-type nitrate/sulfonate/bicarbonate transport system substrate-binding protein